MTIKCSNFEHMYQNQIIPVLDKYEKNRKEALDKAFSKALLIFMMWFVVSCILANIMPKEMGPVYIIPALFSFVHIAFHYEMCNCDFKNKMKNSLLNSILSLFGQLYWTEKEIISKEELLDINIAPQLKYKNDYDNIIGKYSDINIYISECELYHYSGFGKTKQRIQDFKGIILKVRMNKNFTGQTIVRSKQMLSDFLYSNFKKIELEDIDFNKKYNVYSTDQTEARYLLTTSFMERLSQVEKSFCTQRVECVFKNGQVYFFLTTIMNLFEVASIRCPLKNKRRFKRVYDEINSVLNMIDHFKLDKKLGF